MNDGHYSDTPFKAGRLDRVRQWVRHGTLSLHSLFLRPPKKPALRLLFCHYVFDDQRKQFESIIRYLQSIGEFVSADQVLDILHGRTPLQRNSFHLSFDDGLKNIIRNALPVLCDHGVPAALFVPTSLVSAPMEQYREVRRILATCDVNEEIATWDDLEKARAAGFDIGSHTRTHARLSNPSIPRAVIEDEILGSKEELERRLGDECRYISWPFGRLEDVHNASLEVIRQAGYKACFGAFRGRVVSGVTNEFRIPRHHFAPEWPLSHIKCFAHGAWEAS